MDTSDLLIFQNEGETSRTVIITDAPMTIGRTPDNDIVLDYGSVSRRHAEIRRVTGGIQLTDLGSTHGTLIGGSSTPIAANDPILLTDGAVFHIRPWTIIYRAARSEASVAAQAEQPNLPLVPPPAPTTVEPARPHRPLLPVRPSDAPPALPGPTSAYLYDLPVIYHQDDSFLGRFLLGFEDVWELMEQRQDHMALYFDPRTCPARFLPWLAGWLGLDVGHGWPEDRLRSLLVEAMDLYSWRGTHYGLRRLIELATDVIPTIADDPQQPFVIHIRLTPAAGQRIERQQVERLLYAYKPAFVGYTLEIAE